MTSRKIGTLKPLQRGLSKLAAAQDYNEYIFQAIIRFAKNRSIAARIFNFLLASSFSARRRLIRVGGALAARVGFAPRNGTAVAGALGGIAPRGPARADRLFRDRRVLVIGELSLPQCRRYRVDQKVEMLGLLGWETTVVPWQDLGRGFTELALHPAVVFYRVPGFPEVMPLFSEAERLGLACCFDIDDLIFDRELYGQNVNLATLAPEERRLLLDSADLYATALSACRFGIASTATIAAEMVRRGMETVFTIENALDRRALDLADEMAASPAPCADDTVVIGYGSGTRTHDRDFLAAAPALEAVLEAHPQVRLAIHGDLSVPPGLARFGDRLARVPMLAADDYVRAVATWDISIAPLAPGVFNDAKSCIKFLEASMHGVPTVASPSEPFRRAITHGATGFLAADDAAWRDALTRLVVDPEERHRIGWAACAWARTHYHPQRIATTQLAPLLERVSLAPAAGRPRLLIANQLYPPQNFGGATIVASGLARALAAEGSFDVVVFAGSFAEDLPAYRLTRYDQDGVPVFLTRIDEPLPEPKLDYRSDRMAALFGRVLDAIKPDLVHLHSIHKLGVGLAAACRERGVPYVVTAHDAWWLCARQFMITPAGRYCDQRRIDLRVCSACTGEAKFVYERFFDLRRELTDAALVLTPSRFQEQLYLANGFDPARVRINRNGVPRPRTPPAPRSGRAPIVLGYLGGTGRHKGYHWLKEVMAEVGAGDYVLRLVDVERKLGRSTMTVEDWQHLPGRVEIVPPFEAEDMDAFYADLDVLLFPSQWKESFGLTVREAVLRNVWVIATASGGTVEELVDGENGRVVAMDDRAGFAAAIRALVTEPGRLAGYISPLKERIVDLDAQATELVSLVRPLLADQPAPPERLSA